MKHNHTLKVYIHLNSIQTIATKKIQPTEWCICVDIHLYLNRESVTHSRRLTMTRLIYAQSKLSKETQTSNKHRKNSMEKLSAGKATCTRRHQKQAHQPSNAKSLWSTAAPPDTAKTTRFAALTRIPIRSPPRRVKTTRWPPRDRTNVKSGWSTRDWQRTRLKGACPTKDDENL